MGVKEVTVTAQVDALQWECDCGCGATAVHDGGPSIGLAGWTAMSVRVYGDKGMNLHQLYFADISHATTYFTNSYPQVKKNAKV